MEDKEIRYFTIPNILTLLGLISGSTAIFYSFGSSSDLEWAAYFIGIALIFDFLDGLAARLLNQQSKIGKVLDSLSDLVNFGIAPSVILFRLLMGAVKLKTITFEPDMWKAIVVLLPVLLILAAALRLAKYTADKTQSAEFKGLPVPAAAALIASLPLIKDFDPGNLLILSEWLDIIPFKVEVAIIGLEVIVMERFWFYLPIIGFSAIFMLLNVPMFSLKFKGLSMKGNRVRYIFIIISLLLFALMQIMSVPIIIFIYTFIGLFTGLIRFIKAKKNTPEEQDLSEKSEKQLNGSAHFKLSIPDLNTYSAQIRVMPMSEIVQRKNEEILKEIRDEYDDVVYDIKTGNYINLRLEAESKEAAGVRVDELCAKILKKHELKDYTYSLKQICEE